MAEEQETPPIIVATGSDKDDPTIKALLSNSVLVEGIIDFAKEFPVTVAQHVKQQLVPAFGKDVGVDTIIANAIAETAKEASTRDLLASSGIISCVVGLLNKLGTNDEWNEQGVIQCFRALANCCFDHDGGRDAVSESGGIEAILTTVETICAKANPNREDDSLLHMAAPIAIYNILNTNKEILEKSDNLGLPRWIAKLYLLAKTDVEQTVALKTVYQNSSNDALLAELADNGGVEKVLTSFLNTANEAMPTMDMDGFDGESNEEDRESGVFESTVLRELVKTDDRLRAFAKVSVISDLIKMSESRNLHFVGNACILLSVIMGDDEGFKLIMGDDHDATVDRFVGWINLATKYPKNWDPPSAGAIAIGNISRSAEKAEWIVNKSNVVTALIQMLHTDKSGFQFSALGAIKNMAVLKKNKQTLIEANVMEGLMVALKDSQGVLQYNAAGIIRSLCMNQSQPMLDRICATDGLFDRLNHLGKSEEEAVRSESVRVFANVARFSTAALPETFIAAIPSVVKMADSPHTLLKSEALVTLVRLTKQFHQQVSDGGALDLALKIISDQSTADPINPELVCNALSLIGSLRKDIEQNLGDSVMSTIKSLAEHEDKAIATHSTAILASLSN